MSASLDPHCIKETRVFVFSRTRASVATVSRTRIGQGIRLGVGSRLIVFHPSQLIPDTRVNAKLTAPAKTFSPLSNRGSYR